MQKRPKIISLLAGWLILCSAIGVVILSITISTVDSIQTNGEMANWIVDHVGRGGLLSITLIVYAIAGSIGFGLWRLRQWGRLGLLVLSSALVSISFVIGGIAALKAHTFDGGALLLAVVFGWPLYYFNRPPIKALFT